MATKSEAPQVKIVDYVKNTNLHALALNGDHLALAKFSAGKKIDAPNAYGLTPLMFAARNGHFEAIKVLLDLRADATKINKYGGSVFLMAVASGNLDVVNILLQHLLSGGVSRRVIENQFSPIALSILFGHEHVFKFLIGSKFNIGSVSLNTELTPLMYASLSENPIFKKHLLLLGADPTGRNANNKTSEDIERHVKGSPVPPPLPPPPDVAKFYPPPLQIVVSQYEQQQPQHQQQHQHQQVQQPLAVEQSQPNQLQEHYLPQYPPVQQSVQSPMILVSPQLTPFCNWIRLDRKSSDTYTPDEITPNISPVGYYPQIFFPADFTPTQFASPAANSYYLGRSFAHPGHSFGRDYIMSPCISSTISFFPQVHNMHRGNEFNMEDVFYAA